MRVAVTAAGRKVSRSVRSGRGVGRSAVLGLLAASLATLSSGPALADGCDALIARMIRGTGASFAGRDGALAVFRAADAERMSLDCSRRRMVFSSLDRQPNRYYFVLIGLAAKTLLGARAGAVEDLAIRLQLAALARAQAQEGSAGSARLRCETSDRPDGFSDGTLCRLASDRPPRHRRKALPASGNAS